LSHLLYTGLASSFVMTVVLVLCARSAPNGNVWRMVADAFSDGWRAATSNRLAAIFLWICGAGIAFGYYSKIGPVRDGLDAVAHWKENRGLLFAGFSTAIFGGVIPAVVSVFTAGPRDSQIRYLPVLALFWGWKGVEAELLYRIQAGLFGTSPDIPTIACKVMVDMGIYVPLIAVPSMAIFFALKEIDFDWKRLPSELGAGWYRRLGIPLLVTDWIVWIPAVCAIYAFPLALQLPIQNIVLCFFSLVLLVLTHKQPSREPVPSV
jgi:hypothetical protein